VPLRADVYNALKETARACGVSSREACNQAMWLWAHVVRELDPRGVVRLRLVRDRDQEDEEDDPPPGTIHVRRFNGERVWVLPPPWLGRPDERPPSSAVPGDLEAAQPLSQVAYLLAVRVIVANAVVFILTVLTVLSIVKVLGPR